MKYMSAVNIYEPPKQITVLCTSSKSNYKQYSFFDCWDASRNAHLYNGTNPVISHAPCAQWSSLKKFSTPDLSTWSLAIHCWKKVIKYGGVFEHPAHSSFFKFVNAPRENILSIDQHWFGLQNHKRTWLYFSKCRPLSFPLNFDTAQFTLANRTHFQRSETPHRLALYMAQCINSAGLFNPCPASKIQLEIPQGSI